MELKVGDIIVHNMLGLMYLTEEYVSDKTHPLYETDKKFFGTPLFKMKTLTYDGNAEWILYDSKLKSIRLATDKDIVEGIDKVLNNYVISDTKSMQIFIEDEAIAISESGNDNGWIWLNRSEVARLKELLQDVNV